MMSSVPTAKTVTTLLAGGAPARPITVEILAREDDTWHLTAFHDVPELGRWVRKGSGCDLLAAIRSTMMAGWTWEGAIPP